MTARNWLTAAAIVMALCALAILLPFVLGLPPAS